MELWDIYDQNRRPTGKRHVRGIPLEIGEYHLVADVWTVNGQGKILLTQRHPDKPHGLMWECTGGSVQAGEDSLKGAVRELSEEVGIEVLKEELHLIHSICLKERFIDTYITCQDFRLEDLRLQKEEVVAAQLVTIEELMVLWKEGLVVPKSRFLLYKDAIEDFVWSLGSFHNH